MTEHENELKVKPGETVQEHRARFEEMLQGRRQESEAGKQEAGEGLHGSDSVVLRLGGHRRGLEQAATILKAEQQKLYRKDGTKFYGDEEQSERLESLQEEFKEKIERLVSEAEEDAKGYEQEAHSYTYTDPTKDLTSSEREHLNSSRPFVAEDCERLSVEDLADRIEAVSYGTDKVAKVLHARYGASRLSQIDELLDEEASTGRRLPGLSENARSHVSGLRAAVGELRGEVKDPKVEKRRQDAQEAAKASRQLVRDARARKSELDGTAERASRREAERVQAVI